ncbi:MAG: hypothetical protein EHM78_16255 [Myxococcaceae bacterium]|nr:MAG: hypothetical protein EHM78_16255 [Myxococcaceae bacterium]
MLRNFLKAITPPARERPGDWVQHPDYFVGKEALAKDDAAGAREAFLRVLAERPEQLDAKAGLALATYLLGDPGALAQVDEVLTRALGGTTELLRVTLEELGPAAEARALRPSLAWRVAQRLDADPDGGGARSYYEVASRAEGLMGLKARVRSLELDPEPTLPALSAADDLTRQEPELQKRVAALLRKLAPGERRFVEMPPEDTHLELELRPSPQGETGAATGLFRPPPRIVPVRLEAMDDAGLRVTSVNGTNPLPFRRILALALGIVPAADGRNTVITDLVLSWPEGEMGSTVLRLHLADVALDRFYPGVPPKEAYLCWVRDVAARSGAKRLPPGTEDHTVPRYASPDEMTRQVHGEG